PGSAIASAIANPTADPAGAPSKTRPSSRRDRATRRDQSSVAHMSAAPESTNGQLPPGSCAVGPRMALSTLPHSTKAAAKSVGASGTCRRRGGAAPKVSGSDGSTSAEEPITAAGSPFTAVTLARGGAPKLPSDG